MTLTLKRLPSIKSAGLLLCVLLGGCAATGDNAVFVTKTSFSLLDADTTPGGVSIAYDRVEGYVGPKFSDGSVYPVVGYISIGGKDLNRNIGQSYATGDAAIRVTAQSGTTTTVPAVPATQLPTNPAPSGRGPTPGNATPASSPNKTLYFATATTAGLKLAFGDGGASSVVFGYKRKELSVIPVAMGSNQPSVLATFNNAAGAETSTSDSASAVDGTATKVAGAANTTNPIPRPKFEVQQYFATGIAAEQLASDSRIQEQFKNAARVAMTPVQQYQAVEADQGRIALDVLSCIGTVDDAKLPRVWNNAEDLQIFLVQGAVNRIRAKPVATQRQQYLLEMDVLQVGGGKASQTSRLLLHKNTVCGYAAKKGA